ncbi:hypothetical protein [Sinorhizobium sp. RAC02]|uniref:hypothetical protein n=1 Tax=Sinorhizobium sp. RAC02 TaxID=1842534 RepID=UPI00083D1E76|nr:hypothetical protein [Sinorhizobium sp. RAC02]AOF92133.1 hypothetical protein BSY16_717 [Sinorhizobium sp. RAC02]
MSRTDRPACDLVRRALHAVVTSETFARSERLRSFLSYVVECELSGKAAHLKGYSIGIDVFGRPPGFDAGNDPLVRVQAGKLRKLLDLYYETEGASDPLRIRVPLGSYVPEYAFTAAQPAATDDAGPPPRPEQAREKPVPRRSWLPAPISSPLALFSLLPLFFLAPSVYPETTNAAIAKAQLVLSVQNRFAGQTQALPSLYIQQCWPAGGECNAFARAIANSAGYHRTVHLTDSRKSNALHALSYAIRIENRADGRGIYARLIHEQSGATIYVRHFSREQLRSEAGIAFEAVNFAARTLSASGPLYRHAMQIGTASRIMQCLTRTEPHPGTPRAGQHVTCDAHSPAALAEATAHDEAGAVVTR